MDVITRDVCIIGGGSTGTYSAIQLHKAGKSIMVIEKEQVLGGHSNTYINPETNQVVDYGVVVFENMPVVKNYFDYLNVEWDYSPAFGPYINNTKYFDFSKGKIENNVTIPDPQHALQVFMSQLIKYAQLQDGYFLPNPVPDDLLLPFGEFVNKYRIEEIVGIMWMYGQGIDNLLRQPTLYVLKVLSLNSFQKDFVERFIVPKDHNNLNIYNSSLEVLKNNVLLKSYPIRINRRNCNFVEVTVKTPTGVKLIKAKKLLVTIPPNNLYGFDLNSHETNIFNQFKNTFYYTGLVRNTGIPPNFVSNINTNNPYGLPTLPGLYLFQPTIVDDLFDIKYCSLTSMTEEEVKADIVECIFKLQKAGIAKKTGRIPEFVAFNSHVPYELTVSVEAIRNGFYDQLYGLQGKRNTYWTGAAFHVYNSALMWKFSDEFVLPLLFKSLE